MTCLDLRMARIYADELSHALSAQITMERVGVMADFPAASKAIAETEHALRRIADQFGLKLVPDDYSTPLVREGSEHLQAAE